MEFYEYLKQLGFNEQGAKEVVERIDHGSPDREDVALYERYKQSEDKEKDPQR